MIFSEWAHKHNRSILFLLVMLTLGGIVSIRQIPVSLFPRAYFPRIVVGLDAGDRPAERMLIEVTIPMEEALRAVYGVRNMRSTTSRGVAEISINFDWGEDMTSTMLQAESAITQVITSLPQGTTFDVRRMDPTVFPVLCYSLTSDTKSLVELRDIAQYQFRPVLTAITGVAKVEILGGRQEEYRIDTDFAKLNSYGFTFNDLINVVSAQNILTAVGRLEDHDKLYLLISNAIFKNLEEISSVVIRSDANGIIRLKDVAQIHKDVVPEWSRVTADGHEAVIFQVYQQPGGNTVQISKDITSLLQNMTEQLPKDIKIANWYDQSQLIISSANSVRNALIFGVILAVITLLLFLKNFRITLIAAIVVPSVLVGTILVLAVFRMGFNIMTLGGLAAAVGLIIDDSVVLIEHVIRRVRSGHGSCHIRIKQAASEFAKPLTGSSLSTIIIFAPLTFLSGVTGAFFKALSITMAASLFISFLVTWFVVPLLAIYLLREKDTIQSESGRLTSFFHKVYTRLMHIILPNPRFILAAIIPLLLISFLAYNYIGSGFMPIMDEGGFILDYRAVPGTSLTETDRLLRQIENILIATPEVETYSRRTGLQLGGGITEASEGDFFIRLKPFPRRDIEEVMQDVRIKIEQSVPGLQIEMLQLMEDVIGDLTAVPQPIEIEIFSDKNNQLMQLAPKVAKAIQAIPGVVDVSDGIVLAGDALEIKVDREKAAFEGMDVESITKVLSDYLSGQVSTEIQKESKMVGVRIWVAENQRSTDTSIQDLLLRAPDGHVFPLKRVAAITAVSGQPQIKRDNLKRMVAVTARISGRDMGSTIRDIKKTISKQGLIPPDVYYALGGLYAQQQIAFRGMITVFTAAAFLVFLLLLFLYESFRVAMAMFLTTLLAVAAVFAGLWVTGIELNISAMMGMTMIIGIVTEVNIFYFSEFHELSKELNYRVRLVQAGINRMRPIAMTTFAAIFALMPLALGIGQGAAMQQPLAIAIIAGLVVQLPLALVVLPAFLEMFKIE